MKKIIVIGCPGSGKSTFSKSLESIINIPLYHLDMMYWNKDKTTVDKQIFLKRLSQVLSMEKWIIDGNYASTMEMRMKECDTVIFLDYPTDVCLSGALERRGKVRSDIPWVEAEGEIDEDFISFIRNYREKSRPDVFSLLEKYNDKQIYVFQSRKDGDSFLESLLAEKSCDK